MIDASPRLLTSTVVALILVAAPSAAGELSHSCTSAYSLGDMVLARRLCEEELAAAPQDAQRIYRVGLIHERLGHKERAMLDYRRALAIDPNLSPALDGLHRIAGEKAPPMPKSLHASAKPRPVSETKERSPPKPTRGAKRAIGENSGGADFQLALLEAMTTAVQENEGYQRVEIGGRLSDISIYLQRFPNGVHASLVRSRLHDKLRLHVPVDETLIFFGHKQSALSSRYKSAIDETADRLRNAQAGGDTVLVATGFSNADEGDQRLAIERALSVRTALLKAGVPSEAVVVDAALPPGDSAGDRRVSVVLHVKQHDRSSH